MSANYSFLIFQWAEVLGPLLRLRNNHAGAVPLRPGTVRLSIAGYGVIKMYVPPEALTTEPPVCTLCKRKDAPDVQLGALQATRLLFGPRPPTATVDLAERSEVAALLASWCPLLMCWAKQYGV